MNRIVHPECVGCGGRPEFESSLWPRIQVCYPCLYNMTSWFAQRMSLNLLDANPLTEELFGNVFQGGTLPNDSQYTIWHRGVGRALGSSEQKLIRRVDKKFRSGG